jgi:hypothetical protein
MPAAARLGQSYSKAGAPLVVASALSGLLRQFACVWPSGGGEGPGGELFDVEAADMLTPLILYGIAGRPTAGFEGP